MATIEIPTLPEDFRSANDCLNDCLELGVKFRELRSIHPDRRGDTWDADRRRAAQELLEANHEFDMARSVEGFVREMTDLKGLLDAAEARGQHAGARGPEAAFLALTEGRESAGAQFVRQVGDKLGRNMTSEADGVEVRNLLTGSSIGTSGSDLFAPVGSPLYTPQTNNRRRLFVRDLLTVQNTGLTSVPYIKELNAAANEGGASAVSEASAKPEVTMQFERDDAPIRKLAAWVQATEEALSDSATLRGYIDSRLAYMVLFREEAEILNGSGTSPSIKGIRQFSGVQTAGSAEMFAVATTAVGKIENVGGSVTGVAVNPLDYWAAVGDRHSEQFDGQAYGGNSPFGAPSPTMWGFPVVRTPSIESGKALFGDWSMGATMFEKEGITIRTTDSHASLFISNTWVILAEERIGLAVHRPDWFCLATVSAPS